MTRFRHDLILRMIKLLDAVLVTIPFAMCWYLYYAKRVASPYYAMGDYLVVALFFVLFIIFGRVYDAFLMSMQRISEIIYEQFLAAAVSDFIMYVVIWLLSKHLPNILPGVAALVGQVIMASIWAYNAHHAYFKTFPPQATAVIYDTRRGMERLIGKYGLDAKYKVVSTAMAGECIENLSMLDGISTVFLSGIHSHDRNIILKYCVENNITVFVVPRIGDTIMSGAHHMHMFHLPMLRVGPLSDRVVLKMTEAEETTKGGIILTGSAKEKPSVAEVIAVGPGGMVDGNPVTMTVKPGDKVITDKYAGTKITLEDVEYIIVKQGDILAIVE